MTTPETIDIPTFDEIQLGPPSRSETCGCLRFHLDNLDLVHGLDHQTMWDAAKDVLGGLHKYLRIISHSCPNTIANRRKAQKALHAAIEACGYDVPKGA